MENSHNQPTAENSIEGARLRRAKEALEERSTVSSGSRDKVQPQELSVKDKAENFIGKALWKLVDLKSKCGEDEEMKTFHDSIGLCVSRCYDRKEMEAYMLATHGVPAEEVGILYDMLVLGTGDLSGGKAYEKHSINCARLRREKEEEEALEERRLSGCRASTSGREDP